MTVQELWQTTRDRLSKHDVIACFEARNPKARVDSALPQEWADAHPDKIRTFGWVYDDQSSYGGRPLDLRPWIERVVGEYVAQQIEDGALDSEERGTESGP